MALIADTCREYSDIKSKFLIILKKMKRLTMSDEEDYEKEYRDSQFCIHYICSCSVFSYNIVQYMF